MLVLFQLYRQRTCLSRSLLPYPPLQRQTAVQTATSHLHTHLLLIPCTVPALTLLTVSTATLRLHIPWLRHHRPLSRRRCASLLHPASQWVRRRVHKLLNSRVSSLVRARVASMSHHPLRLPDLKQSEILRAIYNYTRERQAITSQMVRRRLVYGQVPGPRARRSLLRSGPAHPQNKGLPRRWEPLCAVSCLASLRHGLLTIPPLARRHRQQRTPPMAHQQALLIANHLQRTIRISVHRCRSFRLN